MGAGETDRMIVDRERRSRGNRVAVGARAARFPVEMPVRYRGVDELDWHEGVTENVSRSGVLFRSGCAVNPNAEVQMDFLLPVEVVGSAGAEVECRGRVVRVEEPAGEPGGFRVAATILDYRFVRAD